MHQTDIIFNVLLNADIDNILPLCLTNHDNNKICEDVYFWINKFKHDKLPIMVELYPITIYQWVIEYKHVETCYGTVKNILIIN